MTATKLTAANCRTLKIARRLFNGKIYKRALEVGRDGGEDAILAYLQTFVRRPIRETLDGFASDHNL